MTRLDIANIILLLRPVLPQRYYIYLKYYVKNDYLLMSNNYMILKVNKNNLLSNETYKNMFVEAITLNINYRLK